MPDHKNLKIGDQIRILRVPKGDLAQKEREIAKGIDDAGWTADTIALIIAQCPIVTIDNIDDFGLAWFTCTILVKGQREVHRLAVMEDESWEIKQKG